MKIMYASSTSLETLINSNNLDLMQIIIEYRFVTFKFKYKVSPNETLTNVTKIVSRNHFNKFHKDLLNNEKINIINLDK